MRESAEITYSGNSVPASPVLSWRSAQVVFWMSLVAGWLWTIYLLWHSPGALTPDEIGHFIIARNAWHSPSLILNAWGRPVNTLIYMIPAVFGLTGVRVAATLMSALTVIFAAKLAKKLGAKYYFAIPIVVWFQLWYCDYGHAAIVEIPFSLLMVVCAYFFVSGEFLAVSVVVGILPYVRDEAIAFALLWAAHCVWKRRWGAAIIAILPAVLINVMAQLVLGASQLGMYANLHPIGNLQMKLYGVGPWSYYPKVLIDNVGIPVLALAVYALAAILRESKRMMVFAFYGSYLAIHMTLYHFGLFGVGGCDRYVFPVAPAIGVAAVFGLEYIVGMCQSASTRIFRLDQKLLAPAVIAAALALIVVDGARYKVLPLAPDAVLAKKATAWIRSEKLAGHPLMSTDVYFYYYLPLRVRRGLWQYGPKALPDAKPGTVAIWDSYSSNYMGMPSTSFSAANGWQLERQFDFPAGARTFQARFLVYEKRSPKTFNSRLPAPKAVSGKRSTAHTVHHATKRSGLIGRTNARNPNHLGHS